MSHACPLTGVLVTLSGWIASTVVASPVFFNNRARFLDATLNDANYTFEIVDGFPVASSAIRSFADGRVTCSSVTDAASIGVFEPRPGPGNPNQVLTGRDQASTTDTIDYSAAVTLNFPNPIYAIGWDDVALEPASIATAVVDIRFADNSAPQKLLRKDDDDNPATPIFIGIVSDSPIAALKIYSAATGFESAPDYRPNAIDNLLLADPVPETSGLAATVLIAGSTVLPRKRRRLFDGSSSLPGCRVAIRIDHR